MKRFNLSEWAVTHRPMVLFLIIATLVVGGLSFNRLGRLEDPNFDVPQMTAIVVWPGATAQPAGTGALRLRAQLRAPGLRRHHAVDEGRQQQGRVGQRLVPGAQEDR
jgi:hypothetical protein